jgi:hypothetical protein
MPDPLRRLLQGLTNLDDHETASLVATINAALDQAPEGADLARIAVDEVRALIPNEPNDRKWRVA